MSTDFWPAVAAVRQDQERGESNLLSNAPRFTTEHCFLEGSQVSSVCPSGEISVQIEMSVLHLWNDTDRRNEVPGGKPFTLALCPPYIIQVLAWDRTQRLIV